MKYPNDFVNKIICGDCLEVMKEIPDKSIDLVLTDPPYGLNIAKSGSLSIKGASSKKREFTKSNWDKKPSYEIFKELLRVSDNLII
jgi:site-specific DNA-methyltransferase (adenine-specific)